MVNDKIYILSKAMSLESKEKERFSSFNLYVRELGMVYYNNQGEHRIEYSILLRLSKKSSYISDYDLSNC